MKIAQLKSPGLPGMDSLCPFFRVKVGILAAVFTLLIFSDCANAHTSFNIKQAIKIGLDNYGTIKANGQNGPAYAFGPAGIASVDLPLATQKWNAVFGSLYLAKINWDYFAFGRSKQKIETADFKKGLDASICNRKFFSTK